MVRERGEEVRCFRALFGVKAGTRKKGEPPSQDIVGVRMIKTRVGTENRVKCNMFD